MASGLPNIILAKSCGIQINVRPVDAGPLVFIISSTSGSAIPISVRSTAKTVPNIMIPASKVDSVFVCIDSDDFFCGFPDHYVPIA